MERNSRKLIKLLEADGFVHVSTKGDHHKYAKGSRRVIVTHPVKDIPRGTLRQIYKDAGWL